MPNNDFLPFAAAGGANVITQSAYQGLASRLSGFIAGVAEPTELNKVWRQSALVSAMLGQFIVDNAVLDALDNGDAGLLQDGFEAALRAYAGLRRATTAGTAGTATIAFTPPYLSYTGVFFLADVTTSLDDGATLKVDGLPPRALLRSDGTAIQKGDAPAGSTLFVVADASSLRVLNMTAYAVQSGSTNYAPAVRVSGTGNAIGLTMIPAVTTYKEGAVYRFKAINPNTGPTTISINGLTAKPVTEMEGTALSGGEFDPGIMAWVMDAGASFVFLRFAQSGPDWSKPLPGLFYAHGDPSPGYTTLVSTVWTKVGATIEEIDSEGWYNASLSRYTPQKPGFYHFEGDCTFGSSGSLPNVASHGMRAFQNGTPSFTLTLGDIGGSHYAGAGNGARALFSGFTYMNGTTDFIEPYAFQDFVDTNGFRRASLVRWGGFFAGR